MSRKYFDVREDYTGTGSIKTYSFDFKIERPQDILIIQYDQDGLEIHRVRGTDVGSYLDSLTFNEIKGGGSITLVNNLPPLHKLILLLANDEPTQNFEFKRDGDLSLPRVERAFDWAVGPIQRLAYLAKRALRFPDNTDVTLFNPEIPSPVPDKVLGFKTDGSGFEWVDPLTIEPPSNGLPDGGLLGDLIAKQSDTDQDVIWKSYGAKGFSSRFSQIVDTDTLEETIAFILAIVYSPPTVGLSASGSGTLREKGTAVTATALAANITKRSDPIAAVRFYEGPSLIHTVPSPNPAGGTESYNWTGSFTDNKTFSVQVDDDGSTGGPTTVTANASFNFVYPYFNGAGAVGENVAAIQGMTKLVIANTASLVRTMVATNGQVLYLAYPQVYGALTSILDVNNFETIGDWTRTTRSFVGLDGSSQSYYVYEFNNPLIAGSYQYTFKR